MISYQEWMIEQKELRAPRNTGDALQIPD